MRLTALMAGFAAVAMAAAPPELETAFRTGGDRPADLSFELRILGERSAFYPGEPIPAEMVFQATTEGVYQTTSRSSTPYRDWGTEGLECVPPLDESPAAPYFRLSTQMMGGVAGIVPIGPNETAIPLRARDFLRLDKPGTYQIRVATSRIVRLDPDQDGSLARSSVTLVSDPVAVTIREPNAAWESSQLSEILAALDDPAQRAVSYSPELLQSLGRLSYLTSRKAADAMVLQIGRQGWTGARILLHGLAGSAHYERIYQSLEAAVEAPEQSMSGASITALAALQAFHRFAPEGLRPEDDPGRYDREINRLRDAIDRRLLATLPNKSPAARASCLKTLMEELSTRVRGFETGERPDWDALRPLLNDSLPELSLSDLQEILNSRWEMIRAPSLRSFLLQLAEADDAWYAATYGAAPPDSSIVRQVREIAIRRLCDLAPVDARRVILAEVQKPRSRVEYRVLLELPDESLPELDPILLEQLKTPESGFDRNRALALVERYATGGIYEEIRKLDAAWFAGSGCDTPASLLAYYIRVDAEYGIERLTQAVESGPDYCRMNVLIQVAQVEPHPGIEKIAAQRLYDPAPMVVYEAAIWLSGQGSADAEGMLWKRLEAFHAEWDGREAELRRSRNDARGPDRIENGLVTGLLNIESARAQLARLQGLCVTNACRKQTGAWRSR